MNRTDLIEKIAEVANLPKTSAGVALDAVLDAITASLKSADPVTLTGFGTFTVRERSARKGHNPRTGATIEIAATKVVGFKAGKLLKDAVNSK